MKPPRVWGSLVRCVCPPEDRVYVMADLRDGLESRARAQGAGAARRWYRGQVLRSLFPLLGRRLARAPEVLRGLAGVGIFADLRYALRRLLAAPLQALVTVISLAVGIGLATSVFAVAHAFLLQSPGGIDDADGLVAVYTSGAEGDLYQPTSFPDFQDVEDGVDAFGGLAAVRPGVVSWGEGENSERILVEMVTGDYFDVLGTGFPLGRGFLAEETVVGRAREVTVLSYDLWQERFGADPGVLGRTVRFSGRAFVVVGVAPRGLVGRMLRMRVGAWVPLGLPGGLYHATPGELVDRADREYLVFGRLRDGVDISGAQGRLEIAARRLHEEHGGVWEDDGGRPRSFTVLPEREARVPPSMRAAMMGTAILLLCGALAVLLLACANVAGLFLARGHRRWREVAVRLSLGGSRGQVVRLLLVEAAVLAVAGGSLGLFLSTRAVALLGAFPLPLDIPLGFQVGIGWPVAVFATTVSAFACLAFGLLPAIQTTRPDVARALKGEARLPGMRRHGGLGPILVAFQVGVTVMLLVSAGLFLRGAAASASLQQVLETQGIALASFNVREEGVTEADVRTRIGEIADRLRARPEIEAVAVASVPDLSSFRGGATARVAIEGYQPEDGEGVTVPFNSVSPGYFRMVGLEPSLGRLLGPEDGPGGAPAAVVSEAFARRYLSGASPLGRRLTILEKRTFSTPYVSPPRTFEIVGVAPDVPVGGGDDGPYFWTAYGQNPTPLAVFHVRGRERAAALVPVLREEVTLSAGEVQLVSARPYDDLVSFLLLPARMSSRALIWAGGFALVLALMGVYGLVAFTMERRTREIALRQAVGGGRARVMRQVASAVLRLAAMGAVGGAAAAVAVGYLARGLLGGVGPADPWALLGGLGVLAVGVLAAVLVPARRALGAAPMEVLRRE